MRCLPACNAASINSQCPDSKHTDRSSTARRVEPSDRPKGVDGCRIAFQVANETLQFRNRISRISFNNQPLPKIPSPTIRVLEKCKQIPCRLRRFERPRLRLQGFDPKDATFLGASTETQVLADAWRKVVGVFDHLAVHVDDIKSAVGSVGETNWPEPSVGRC